MDSKKKILIVEDDMFIRDIYQARFFQEGFEVEMAGNGIEALEKIEIFIPDVILLDIIMPQMDGMETLKKIRSIEAFGKTPIIMLTNISEKEKSEEAKRYRVSDYLIKSQLTPSEVVGKVVSLLDA